ncbi:hypothetical protein AB0D49_13190 [Streptomyces sp. NPDC048290]|uniref:hypothetical protein n=1 Tax=Streptomyces sp. NPDC048290 TaxID=3155811 RepID=UPI00341F3A4A
MTITTGAPPRRSRPVAVALAVVRGLLTGAVAGGSLAALVVGPIADSVPLFGTGLVLPVFYGLLLLLPGARRRAREAAEPPRTALAQIEDLQAQDQDGVDVPVRFDLTVAPDDAPAHRVQITQNINAVDLPDHRPGGVLVVRYPPSRPWQVRIVRRPTPEWEERAAGARIDSAPGPAVPGDEPSLGTAGCYAFLLTALLGAALVVFLFRADLFEETAPPTGRTPSGTSTSSSTTTVVTSATGTLTLGEGQSMLDEGQARRAMDSLTEEQPGREALSVVVQERMLTVVFVPTGDTASGPALGFDPGSLPYGRLPALVAQARSTLGAGTPATWQLTADRTAGALTLRIAVTGPKGTGVLEADARGEVQRRTPATG